MINREELVQKLFLYMQKNEMSYQEIAKALDISRPTTYRLFQPNKEMKVKTAFKIKNFLEREEV